MFVVLICTFSFCPTQHFGVFTLSHPPSKHNLRCHQSPPFLALVSAEPSSHPIITCPLANFSSNHLFLRQPLHSSTTRLVTVSLSDMNIYTVG